MMNKTLTILLALLLPLAARGQYRYNSYLLLGTTTNATVAATAQTAWASADVAASTHYDLQLVFSLTSSNGSAMSATCSNPVAVVVETSIDQTYWTNRATYTLTARSNIPTWGRTNFSCADAAWVRVAVTNGNFATLTNYTVRVGAKIGL